MFFERIRKLPPDPVFGLQSAYKNDIRKEKVNLSIGIYQTLAGRTPVLGSVKKAEKALYKEERSKVYLPIQGDEEFLDQLGHLAFGKSLWTQRKDTIAAIQTLGGTGALSLGGELLRKELGDIVYVSDFTWVNHRALFERLGFTVKTYPYFDETNHSLNFDKMVQYISSLPSGSLIVMQASCHNPTGLDPTDEQWRELSKIFVKNRLIPFFDVAYQGFGTSLFEDIKAVQIFVKEEIDCLIAYSCSKNFGLYNERIGALLVPTSSSQIAESLSSQLRAIARTNYSNPPWHGAAIVAQILKDDSLRKDWEKDLSKMRSRINDIREQFIEALERFSGEEYQHFNEPKGLFLLLGLTEEECTQLIEKNAIYVGGKGRINLASLNHENVEVVAQAAVSIKR